MTIIINSAGLLEVVFPIKCCACQHVHLSTLL
jgi:hypothetical protein